MNWNPIKQAASYFVPFTKKIRTRFNGLLEVRWINGHKVLDTVNANYSYGSAQRVLKFSLEKIYTDRIDNILLLGLGGGSIIKTLEEVFDYSGEITAVDIDPDIIRIAAEEFGICPGEKIKIVCADAFEYIKMDPALYDLIVVDLFIDNKVPDQFLSGIFWEYVCGRLREGSHIIFNSISHINNNIEPVKVILGKNGIGITQYDNVEGTNRILIGKMDLRPE